MNAIESGTVLITGPTGGLGKATTLAIAHRPAAQRPDLLLVGGPAWPSPRWPMPPVRLEPPCRSRLRPGPAGRRPRCGTPGQGPYGGGCGASASGDRGERRRLGGRYPQCLGGRLRTHLRRKHLAHAQLIGDLLDSLVAPARMVLLGSNTYHQNIFRRILRVPPAVWRDPIELPSPPWPTRRPPSRAPESLTPTPNSRFLYAHELQRRSPKGINVTVYEPGFMPGTGLSRGHGPGLQKIGRGLSASPASLAQAISVRARIDRPRRPLGAFERWRIRRQRRKPRSEAISHRPGSRVAAVGGYRRTTRRGTLAGHLRDSCWTETPSLLLLRKRSRRRQAPRGRLTE